MPSNLQYHNLHKHTIFDYIPEAYRDSLKVALLFSVGFVSLALLLLIGQSM